MKLKFLLVKAYKLIEIQKSTINELTTQLNNSNQNLNIYKEKIRQQELQINNLYQQVKNPNTNTKVYKNEMMCVNFISANQQIHYAVPCVKNDTFASVEEKLYQRFPQYRETNNNFLANGNKVKRFKTIGENNIGNGLPVVLVVPPQNN